MTGFSWEKFFHIILYIIVVNEFIDPGIHSAYENIDVIFILKSEPR